MPIVIYGIDNDGIKKKKLPSTVSIKEKRASVSFVYNDFGIKDLLLDSLPKLQETAPTNTLLFG